MAVKNLHLEHLEDEIINNGIDGGRASINFLRGLRDMMKGSVKRSVNMTVKWDGAPALFVGKHPEDGRFFVAKKSLFNKTPKFYTTEQEIKDDTSGDLQTKFLDAFKYLGSLSWGDDILQGDLMFTDGDKEMIDIDGESFISFTPNTITYTVQTNSVLGKKIASAKIGIVFHTTYKGATIEDLSASFGANISSLGSSKDVWMDDASYKDVSGNSTLTAKETLKLTQALTEVGKQFHKIKKPALTKFQKVQDTIQTKGAGASYKTYCNTQIRAGKFKPTYEGYLKHFEDYWKTKVVGAVKMEKTKRIKEDIGKDIYRDLRSLKNTIKALTRFQELLVISKGIIVNGLNRVKTVGTMMKTSTGFKAVNPEGYVAIDDTGKAVKLVDRMEFSQNNFNAAKNWDK